MGIHQGKRTVELEGGMRNLPIRININLWSDLEPISSVYSLPIITSVALMSATAGSPALSARSRTASAVMIAVIL